VWDFVPGLVVRVAQPFTDYDGQEILAGEVLHFVDDSYFFYEGGHTLRFAEKTIRLGRYCRRTPADHRERPAIFGFSRSMPEEGSLMMRIAILGSLASAILCGQTGPGSVRVVVPGASNPYLAGMPHGTKAQKGDTAPEQSPVLVKLSLTGATAITFTVSGEVSHGPMWPAEPPDGSRVLAYHIGSEHGIAGVVAPFESLMGVFLDNGQPDRNRAPRLLTFRAKDRAFTTLHPQLRQVFFIGSGIAKSGAIRRFLIPPGATRLFLGTMDGYGWYNNTGSYLVTATLEGPDVTLEHVQRRLQGCLCQVGLPARSSAMHARSSDDRGGRSGTVPRVYCRHSWSGE